MIRVEIPFDTVFGNRLKPPPLEWNAEEALEDIGDGDEAEWAMENIGGGDVLFALKDYFRHPSR